MSKKSTPSIHLTSRGKHAVLALIELEKLQKQNPVSLANIGKTVDISVSYLEQLFSCMRRDGLVKSYRGPGGGYVLGREAEDINIAEILLTAQYCLQRDNKKPANSNKNLDTLWSKVGTVLYGYLSQISLAEASNENINDIFDAISL